MREALRELEATGLVTNIPRRGTYVAEVMGEGLREIYTVRGALEEQATRIVTPRGSCDLAALQREVDADARRRACRRHARRHRAFGEFHRAIMEAARNRLLLNIWQSLQIETRTTITMLVEGLDLVEIADSHQPIVDADRQRRRRAARRGWRASTRIISSACRYRPAPDHDFPAFPADLTTGL